MADHEYKVIEAPAQETAGDTGQTQADFIEALQDIMNDLARDGWVYQRADTIHAQDRRGLFSRKEIRRTVLVFRRTQEERVKPKRAKSPVLKLQDPVPAQKQAARSRPTAQAAMPKIVQPQYPEDDASRSEGASRMLVDNGVEGVSEVSGVSNSLRQLAATRSRQKSEG